MLARTLQDLINNTRLWDHVSISLDPDFRELPPLLKMSRLVASTDVSVFLARGQYYPSPKIAKDDWKYRAYMVSLGKGRKSPDPLLGDVDGLRDDRAGFWIEDP
jgi:hypothetical protein